jgi:superfamily I DNA/RNA helicase
MAANIEDLLNGAIDKVLHSASRKKLVVAGPGTGKTTLFRKLLESTGGDRKSRIVLTFLHNLKDDLDESLTELAQVFTLHGYSQLLLHRIEALRNGLTEEFRCLPNIATLIAHDWKYLKSGTVPQFVKQMRDLEHGADIDFYLDRGNYYDAVDFDDSVFRTYEALKAHPEYIEVCDLVLIDEYQDFNKLEAGFIDLLASQNPIVIAGDDDQALYAQLRGSSWDFIRSLYRSDEYERFELPFCLRCPEVIVAAVNDVISRALASKQLQGRISKPYQHYEPVKGADSKQYPTIDLVVTTVQRLNANYFGMYIEQAVASMPKEEIEEAATKGYPAALIIGSKQYLRQIAEYLEGKGIAIDTKRDNQEPLERARGLDMLADNFDSNLGWRIILHHAEPAFCKRILRAAFSKNVNLAEEIPSELKDSIRSELESRIKATPEDTIETPSKTSPMVKLTSFEGAKGLSAQHVFIVGLHEGDLPRDPKNIQDIEICRLVVGLTRTRKSCALMATKRFADVAKQPSSFVSWIKSNRLRHVPVDAQYWKK